MRGRKPKPTKLKLLEGASRHTINQNEPMPYPKAPECPDWLSQTSKKEWERIAPQLEKLGLLTQIDLAALAGYCDAFGRWVEASKMLRKEGLISHTKTGYPIQSPYLSIVNTATKTMRSFLCEFGMTPSSRTRVSVHVEPPYDNL